MGLSGLSKSAQERGHYFYQSKNNDSHANTTRLSIPLTVVYYDASTQPKSRRQPSVWMSPGLAGLLNFHWMGASLVRCSGFSVRLCLFVQWNRFLVFLWYWGIQKMLAFRESATLVTVGNANASQACPHENGVWWLCSLVIARKRASNKREALLLA